jgi:hypothetical protein
MFAQSMEEDEADGKNGFPPREVTNIVLWIKVNHTVLIVLFSYVIYSILNLNNA